MASWPLVWFWILAPAIKSVEPRARSSLAGAVEAKGSLAGVEEEKGSFAGVDEENGSFAGAAKAGVEEENGSFAGVEEANGSLAGADEENGSLAGADDANGSFTGAAKGSETSNRFGPEEEEAFVVGAAPNDPPLPDVGRARPPVEPAAPRASFTPAADVLEGGAFGSLILILNFPPPPPPPPPCGSSPSSSHAI